MHLELIARAAGDQIHLATVASAFLLAAIFVQSPDPGYLSWIHIFVLYFGGLLIAGALTVYPGRLMYGLFFG